MSGDHPLLVARGISKHFGGVAALDNVSLEIRPGEVHCLAGENGSGKSTLIKIISGVVTPDAGVIEVGGETYAHLTPRQAIGAGIEVIYQDFSLFPNLTVAENIAITSLIAHGRRAVRPSELRSIARAVVDRIGVGLVLDARVEDLSVADRQLTAICRALAQDARIIFMDEPTTALTWREVRALFQIVAALRESGVALVFVSHKIEEVLRISQRITVLRNGGVVVSGEASEFDRPALIRAMTGRTLSDLTPSDTAWREGQPMLEVEGLGRGGYFEGVTFDVRPGEVLGITGLLGSGRTEIAEALFGVHPADSGSIRVNGQPVVLNSVRDAIRAGFGYVPADRLKQGLFLEQSIARNVIAGSLDRLVGRLNLLRQSVADRLAETSLTNLHVKMSTSRALARSLSGGNQQRVVLAKWLARSPRVLILNSPTVGVDVGSKHEILEMLRAKSREGIGIIVISDDVPELFEVCHRVLVVRRGRIVTELTGDRLSEQAILDELAA
jgi:simple sugar transport system ATP-binding protein